MNYQAFFGVVNNQLNTIAFYHLPEAAYLDDLVMEEIDDYNLSVPSPFRSTPGWSLVHAKTCHANASLQKYYLKYRHFSGEILEGPEEMCMCGKGYRAQWDTVKRTW